LPQLLLDLIISVVSVKLSSFNCSVFPLMCYSAEFDVKKPLLSFPQQTYMEMSRYQQLRNSFPLKSTHYVLGVSGKYKSIM